MPVVFALLSANKRFNYSFKWQQFVFCSVPSFLLLNHNLANKIRSCHLIRSRITLACRKGILTLQRRKKDRGSISLSLYIMICVCLLCVSQQGPCVSAAVLNPPFEMGTWLPFAFPTGSEQRYPTPRFSATPAPVERILKRFGAQTLCCSLSLSLFFFPPLPPLWLSSPPPVRLLPILAEGSFKGLGESAGAAVPARPRGCGAPR